MRKNRLLDHTASGRFETAAVAVLEVGRRSGLKLRFLQPGRWIASAGWISRRNCAFGATRRRMRSFRCRAHSSGRTISHSPSRSSIHRNAWTLCSIASPLAALHRDARGSPKPGGDYCFLSSSTVCRRKLGCSWQHWLTPCWKRIGGGVLGQPKWTT